MTKALPLLALLLAAGPTPALGAPRLVVSVGAAAEGRRHALDAAEGTEVRFTSKAPYLAGVLRLEARPLAASGERFSEHLVLGLHGRWGLLTSTATEAGGAAGATVATPTRGLAGWVGWGLRLWEDDTALAAGAQLEGFLSSYAGPTGDPLYTPISHRGLGLGLWIQWPVLGDILQIDGTFSWRPLAVPGRAEAAAYGPEARGSGLWGRLSVATTLGPVQLGIFGEMATFSATYGGSGSRDRDGQGAERTLRGGLFLAFPVN